MRDQHELVRPSFRLKRHQQDYDLPLRCGCPAPPVGSSARSKDGDADEGLANGDTLLLTARQFRRLVMAAIPRPNGIKGSLSSLFHRPVTPGRRLLEAQHDIGGAR